MTSRRDCIFCRIAAHEAPATVIDEGDRFLAIVPLGALVAGHTLVLPKSHAMDLFDIDPHVLGDLAAFAKHVAANIIAETGATGMNLLHASGADAQQSVFHFHLHLIPRHAGDGLDAWVRRKEAGP